MTTSGRELTVAGFSGEAWNSASPHLRLVAPCRRAGIQLLQGAEWVGGNLRIMPERVAQADLVVLQRDFPRWQEGYRKVIEQADELGKPVVYELDDLLTDLPPEHPDSRHFAPARWWMRLAALEADVVTVASPFLQERMERYNARVRTLPNYLDDAVWPEGRQRVSEGPIVIGYAGSRSHTPDLAYLEPVLLKLLERYGERLQLRFWGKVVVSQRLLGRPGVSWDQAHEIDYATFAAGCAGAGIDIAIAPLVDNEFNNAKSRIKYLEYASQRIPGVYAGLAPYRDIVDGSNGFLATSLEEWERALVSLIENGQLRRDTGNAALATARRYHLSDHAGQWREVFEAAIEAKKSSVEQSRGRSHVQDAGAQKAAAREQLVRKLLSEHTRLQNERDGLEVRLGEAKTRLTAAEGQIETLTGRLSRTEESVRWLESELQQTRNSITWRATEPVRKLYALVERRQARPAQGGSSGDGAEAAVGRDRVTEIEDVGAPPANTALLSVEYRTENFYWQPATFAGISALPTSPVTDIIICIGKSTAMAEKCVRSIQQHTDPSAYRLKIVSHRDDITNLPEWLADSGQIIPHTLEIFNFAIANNLALRQCDGDAVLLNDDTEVTAGWLERLREDSHGVALTGARTGRQCSGNPDMWEPGPARLSWYPINMFCAFIPQRVREVVGLLDEEFFYYGGEDVDYSCRALQHGFPLLVSSAFVHHAGNQTFKGRKERLMQESDKILLERYGLTPPFALNAVKPTVSVITATRNRAELLPNAVHSVLAGGYPEMEVVIVDDASTDNTPAVVTELQREDRRITAIRLAHQSGSERARRIGLGASGGNFIALMDDDDTAWPDRILAPLQHLMAHPDLDVAYCDFDVVAENGRQRGNVRAFNLQDYLDMKFDIGLGVLLVRRRALVDVPLTRYYERAIDYDWVFRLVRRGYRLGHCPAVVLDYNRHGPVDSHLAGNEAAIKQHKMIQEREHLVSQMRRR